MIRTAWVLLVTGACLWADPGTALVEKLYAKLAASFSSGQALGKGGDYLLLACPGYAVSREDCADDYAISILADQIPLPARSYEPSGACYSATYGDLLDHAETSSFMLMADREKARIARRAVFDKFRPGQPTRAYATYLAFQAAWLAAEDALTLAQTDGLISGKVVPPGLDAGVAAALKAWEDHGNKQQVEDAFATLDAFYRENVGALFTDLRDAFAVARSDGGLHPTGYYPVTATPPPETWLADAGWKPFTLTQTERSLAEGGASLPLGARGKVPDDLDASVALTMETKRVSLTRPWLEMNLFKNRRWRLQASGFRMASTGNPADPEPGLMPLMVTGVLLSRKLVLTGRWPSARLRALGPFTLAGAPTLQDGQLTLRTEGAQIIGFFCTSVPRSPDPDEKAFRTQ